MEDDPPSSSEPQNILAGVREEKGPEDQRAGRRPSTKGMPIKHLLVTYCVPKAQDGSIYLTLQGWGTPRGEYQGAKLRSSLQSLDMVS